jgi:hypothetical protein
MEKLVFLYLSMKISIAVDELILILVGKSSAVKVI